MKRYKPQYMAEEIEIGTGSPIVVAGWTPLSHVHKYLAPSDYAALGSLYSCEGINILLRNIFVNPHIKEIIYLAATPSDEVVLPILLSVFEGPKPPTIIESIFDFRSLHLLRSNVKLTVCSDAYQMSKACKCSCPISGAWAAPLDFPIIKPDLDADKPAPYYGHTIRSSSFKVAWENIVHRVMSCGVTEENQRDGLWKSLGSISVEVNTEKTNDTTYGLDIDPALADRYARELLYPDPHEDDRAYTYGKRIRSHFEIDQIDAVIDRIRRDDRTIRGVISLWSPLEDGRSEEPPCLTQISFRVVQGRLCIHALFRSHDVYSGWPYNAFGLRRVQEHVAVLLGYPIGSFVLTSHNAHIYDRSWSSARQVKPKSRQLFEDPYGAFSVRKDGESVEITRYDSSSTLVDSARFTRLRDAESWISRTVPGLDVSHALYLGRTIWQAFQ